MIHLTKNKMANNLPTKWQKPWLDPETDYVWVYQGYGEFTLLPQADDRAQMRLRVLANNPRLYESEKQRLQVALEIDDASRAWERIADTMECVVSLVRMGAL